MAQIDTSSIENFESLSADELRAAIAKIEVPEDMSEKLKSQKAQIDSYSSQIAELKKQQKAGLDEESRNKAEAEERYTSLEAKYNELVKTSTINELTSQFKELGYDPKLAKEKAEAVANNDTQKMLECEMKYRESYEKKLKAEWAKQTPPPDGNGGHDKETSKADLKNMSIKERLEYSKAHPEEYSKIYGGK